MSVILHVLVIFHVHVSIYLNDKRNQIHKYSFKFLLFSVSIK